MPCCAGSLVRFTLESTLYEASTLLTIGRRYAKLNRAGRLNSLFPFHCQGHVRAMNDNKKFLGAIKHYGDRQGRRLYGNTMPAGRALKHVMGHNVSRSIRTEFQRDMAAIQHQQTLVVIKQMAWTGHETAQHQRGSLVVSTPVESKIAQLTL